MPPLVARDRRVGDDGAVTKVLLIALGSRGDVQPLAVLAGDAGSTAAGDEEAAAPAGVAAACGGAVSGRVSPRHRAPPRATTATSATRPHSQAWRLRGGASAGRLRRRRLRAGCSSGSGWVGSLRGTS